MIPPHSSMLLIVLAGDSILPELAPFLRRTAVLIHLTLSYFLQIKCESAVNPMCQLLPGLHIFCLGVWAWEGGREGVGTMPPSF